MHRWKAMYNRSEEFILSAGLMGALFLMVLNVVLRKVFNTGMPWSEEVVRYLIVGITFLGIGFCVNKGAHITIDMLVDRLADPYRRVVLVMVDVICIVYSAIMVYLGYLLVTQQLMIGQKTPALQIPFYIPYLVIPIGFAWGGIGFIRQLTHRLKG